MMPFCIDWAFAQILAVTAPLGYLPETFHEAPLTLCDAIVSTTSNPLRAGLDVNSQRSLLGGGGGSGSIGSATGNGLRAALGGRQGRLQRAC